jgi:hypothetical protein
MFGIAQYLDARLSAIVPRFWALPKQDVVKRVARAEFDREKAGRRVLDVRSQTRYI